MYDFMNVQSRPLTKPPKTFSTPRFKQARRELASLMTNSPPDNITTLPDTHHKGYGQPQY